ncbi:MAG TPA: hypothetical protein VGG10_02955 [Rhizomicrobium sp.]|jgi:Holliday junction resolvasome RuvABC endonuclease subunit
MRISRKGTDVLGFHPSSGGFGWAVLEDSRSLLDWGTVDIRKDKNAIALHRIEVLLERYRPGVLAMERHEAEGRRRPRIRRLYTAVIDHAQKRDIAVYRFSRIQISQCRHLHGARTREEVATAVAGRLAVLRPRLPRARPIWVGERAGMALFCAAACVLTYFDAEMEEEIA